MSRFRPPIRMLRSTTNTSRSSTSTSTRPTCSATSSASPYTVDHADPAGRLLVGSTASGVSVVLEMAPWGDPGWDESIVLGFDRGWIRVTMPAPLASRRAGVLQIHGDLRRGRRHAHAPPAAGPRHARAGAQLRRGGAGRGSAALATPSTPSRISGSPTPTSSRSGAADDAALDQALHRRRGVRVRRVRRRRRRRRDGHRLGGVLVRRARTSRSVAPSPRCSGSATTTTTSARSRST